MASFTDRLPQFNPYIQQLPVEEMAKVGMYKQQKYDEGIQKIQTNIDNVAGLDVYRPVDKAYLQSKLNQLGNDLRFVGAGDFSDFQLVNSVSGMTNQIVRDPNVLNAVKSTQNVRKGFTDMEAAQKAGKSSPSNEWIYNKSVNNYTNSNDLNASFNSSFEEAVDIDKDLREELKSAHADKLAQDEGVMNADGSINHDLINHKIKEGLSTSKVMSIARSVYSKPQNHRQLQIDGLYNYKDYDLNNLLKEKQDTLNYKKELIFAQTPYLRTYATLGAGDKKIQADKDLLSNYETLTSLDDEYNQFSEIASKSLDAAKFESYYQNKVAQVAKDYSWTSEENETKVSPQFDVNMKKSQFALEQQKFQEQKTMDYWSIKKAKAEMIHMANEDAIAQMKLEGKLDADGNAIWTPGTPALNPEEYEKLGSGSFYSDIDKSVTDRNQLFANITSGIGIDYNGKHYTDLYIKGNGGEWKMNPKYLNTDQNKPYLLNDLGSKLYNVAKSQMKSKIDAAGQMHLTGDVDKSYADDIKSWWDQGTVISAKRKAAQEAEEEFKPILDNIQRSTNLKNNYTLPMRTEDGDPYTVNLTKQQVIDIGIYTSGAHVFKDNEDIASAAYSRLKKAFGNNVTQVIGKARNGNFNHELAITLNGVVGQLQSSKSKEALGRRENKFKDMQRQSVGQELTLTSAKPEIKDAVRAGLMAELETIMKDKSSGSYKVAAQILEKVKNSTGLDNNVYKFRYDNKTGKWYTHVTQLSGGGFEEGGAEVEIGEGFVQKFNLRKQLDPKEDYFRNSTIGQVLDTRAGYSTVSATTNDLNSPKAFTTALERGNIGNYSVGFHVIAKDQSNNSYMPFMYIYDKNTGKTYNKVPMDWSKLSALPGLSPDEKRALQGQGTVYDRSQIVPAIQEFKSKLADPRFADQAMKLLIGNYNNQ